MNLKNLSDLQAAPGASHGEQAYLISPTGSNILYIWSNTNTATDDGEHVISATGTATGRWLIHTKWNEEDAADGTVTIGGITLGGGGGGTTSTISQGILTVSADVQSSNPVPELNVMLKAGDSAVLEYMIRLSASTIISNAPTLSFYFDTDGGSCKSAMTTAHAYLPDTTTNASFANDGISAVVLNGYNTQDLIFVKVTVTICEAQQDANFAVLPQPPTGDYNGGAMLSLLTGSTVKYTIQANPQFIPLSHDR